MPKKKSDITNFDFASLYPSSSVSLKEYKRLKLKLDRKKKLEKLNEKGLENRT